MTRVFRASVVAALAAAIAAKAPVHDETVFASAGTTASSVTTIPQDQWDAWLSQESSITFNNIFRNIGPFAEGVMDGGVIASPSTTNPDYFFQWTRDAGITINALVYNYKDGSAQNTTLKDIIQSYVNGSELLQRVSNPSGDFATLDGLGEPKFNVNGTAFTGPWGRPQRDGPAFRSAAIMHFIETQVNAKVAQYSDFEDTYANVIKPDLEYLVEKWNLPGFDYWEEVNGTHLATTLIQLKSMTQAVQFAQNIGDTDNQYQQTANDISASLPQFYDSSKGHLVETLDTTRSGLDAAVLIGAIQSYPVDNMYSPWSDQIIQHLYLLVQDMSTRFSINQQRLSTFSSDGADVSQVGVGLGRYPEDVYNGVGSSLGNPWFLCTTAASEVLYHLAEHLLETGNLTISDYTKDFYTQFGVTSNMDSTNPNFKNLVQLIVNYADSFLDVVREHQDQTTGQLSEEFDRNTGFMTGANDLTWSYGAFYTASRRRAQALQKLSS